MKKLKVTAMKSKYLLLLLFPLTFLFLSFSNLIPGINIFEIDSDNEFFFNSKMITMLRGEQLIHLSSKD